MKNHLSGLTKKFSINIYYIVSAHCQAILQRVFFLPSQSGTSIFWYTNLSAWSRRKTKMSKIWVWKSGGCNFTAQSVSRRQNKQMCFSEQAFYTNLQNLSSQKPSWNTRLSPVCMGAMDSLSRGSAPPKKGKHNSHPNCWREHYYKLEKSNLQMWAVKQHQDLSH